jgi:hypothetical protein
LDRRSPCPSCGSKARLYAIELYGEIGFREKLKAKIRHGKAGEVTPFLELQTGDDFYRKTGEWNRREKLEDRENDRYVEHIVNPKTGEIAHHCEEPQGNIKAMAPRERRTPVCHRISKVGSANGRGV